MDKNIFSKRPNYRLYPESVKKAVVKEYLTTHCQMAHLMRKYNVGSRSVIHYWLKKYGNNEYLSKEKQPEITQEDMADESPDIKELKERIQQLERELEDSKLLADAYSRMIKAAEQELKIPIRKKFNTK